MGLTHTFANTPAARLGQARASLRNATHDPCGDDVGTVTVDFSAIFADNRCINPRLDVDEFVVRERHS